MILSLSLSRTILLSLSSNDSILSHITLPSLLSIIYLSIFLSGFYFLLSYFLLFLSITSSSSSFPLSVPHSLSLSLLRFFLHLFLPFDNDFSSRVSFSSSCKKRSIYLRSNSSQISSFSSDQFFLRTFSLSLLLSLSFFPPFLSVGHSFTSLHDSFSPFLFFLSLCVLPFFMSYLMQV